MARVFVLLREYPQASQTYKETEIRYLIGRGHTLQVASDRPPNLTTPGHHPFLRLDEHDPAALRKAVAGFGPTVVHGHYLHHTPRLFAAAEAADTGFTVRGHSYDVLGRHGTELPQWTEMLNSGRCLGVLTFPFARPLLETAGVNPAKLVDCWPVVDYQAFDDETPNGDAVLNVGACLPKKDHDAFVDLALLARAGRAYNLYPLGYDLETLSHRNAGLDSPVTIHTPVTYAQMPAVYKRHGWMVYTACPRMNTVGWPMAVAEAQAAGVVVVAMQNLRPDLAEYVGPGFLFDTVAEAARIIATPPPEDLRHEGFTHARRSDIADHITLLEHLWETG